MVMLTFWYLSPANLTRVISTALPYHRRNINFPLNSLNLHCIIHLDISPRNSNWSLCYSGDR